MKCDIIFKLNQFHSQIPVDAYFKAHAPMHSIAYIQVFLSEFLAMTLKTKSTVYFIISPMVFLSWPPPAYFGYLLYT